MIDLYTWLTPNGRKVSLMLEECGLQYRAIAVDIGAGDQNRPEFLAISPNGKIPAIVDHDGPIALFESGAILMYLAEKTGMFLPPDAAGRWRAIQWLMFQMGGVGPMLGQAQHFLRYNPGVSAYAEDRYGREAARLYGVLDRRLAQSPYLAGDAYSIADIATWPWIRGWKIQGVDLAEFPNVARWFAEIDARPAVAREREVLADRKGGAGITEQARAVLFGDAAR